MIDDQICPNCGLKLDANAPRGLCPGCLFLRGLETAGGRTEDFLLGHRLDDDIPTEEQLARQFPELDIIRFIGRGGMGMVFQARQKQLDRIVALKILSPKLASNPEFANRFAREARMMAMLTHSHIVNVYEFGVTPPASESDTKLYYLLMEYVDGVTLRQLLNSSELSSAQALEIVPQICVALQYAHDKGVVHRDIKPENILVDRQGNVKIADFGIAKLMGLQGHNLTISTTGQVLGTLTYMAPEQLERPFEVDHRADIYSLGVVFYQMLTGELPIGRFSPPSKKASVDARLDEVVLQALEKEPSRRYHQARTMQSHVETIARTANVLADATTRRAFIKRPTLRMTGLVTGLLVCGAVGCFVLLYVRSYLMAVSSSPQQLYENPQALARATTEQVIEAGIDSPDIPWAWRELERRNLTQEDGAAILNGMINWLKQNYPDGYDRPLHWLDESLGKIDQQGIFLEKDKINYLKALEGNIRGTKTARLRQGDHHMGVRFEWRSSWNRPFDLSIANELKSITLDGQPFSIEFNPSLVSAGSEFFQFNPSELSVGTHNLHLEAVTALIPTKDLVGIRGERSPSIDWLPAKEKWIRAWDLNITVYSKDEQILTLTDDPAFNPTTHGLRVAPLIIRQSKKGVQGVVVLQRDEATKAIPVSVDVAIRLGGRTIPCGMNWHAQTENVEMKSSEATGNWEPLVFEVGELSSTVNKADVILTPNPKNLELTPWVDKIWGQEIVITNVPLDRQDLTKPKLTSP